MGLISEFKKFAMRGSLIDLTIGFTVGASFTTVAKSLVNDIIMPPLGLLLGNMEFQDLFVVLRDGKNTPGPYLTLAAAQEAGAVTLNYGSFINNVVALALVAIVMFAIIRIANRVEDRLDEQFGDEPETPTNKKCPFCRTTIAYKATRCPNCTSQLEEAAT